MSTFAPPQPMVQRPKRLQFSNGTFYCYERGRFWPQDGTDDAITINHFVDTTVNSEEDHIRLGRLLTGEVEAVAESVVRLETSEKAARQKRRLASLVDPRLPPDGITTYSTTTTLTLEYGSDKKPIGSKWMFYPKLAGYVDVWEPGPVTIVAHCDQVPLKPGTPPRDYVVERDGGVRLFANEASLRAFDALPSQAAVSIEERSKLMAHGPAAQPLDASGRKAVDSEWLFNPELAGTPGGKPVLCRIVEQLEPVELKPGTPPRDYRVVTSGGVHAFASDASLSSLEP